MFESVLPVEMLEDFETSCRPDGRRRVYTQVVTFWAWFAQIVDGNASCSKAVSLVQSWLHDAGLPVPSSQTTSYCAARQRLDVEFLERILNQVRSVSERAVRSCDLWKGMTVKAFDGTSITLDDTEVNQKTFPQHSSQSEGCGFPIMGMVGMLNLSTGCWERFSTGKWSRHDARGAHELMPHVSCGDLIVADRAFGSYEFFSQLSDTGAHGLVRLHQARHRILDWDDGLKINSNERLVCWKRPKQQPRGSSLGKRKWNKLPAEIKLRYIRVFFKNREGKDTSMVLVTTLTDHLKYPASEIAELYTKRWDIELKFRDIKQSLGVEHLALKSPEHAKRGLLMLMISYNLLRLQMQKGAASAQCSLTEISFKESVGIITSYRTLYRGRGKQKTKRRQLDQQLTALIAERTIRSRPMRREPRAVKRRPKNYQLLTKHRSRFKEVPHRSSHYRKPTQTA